LEAGAIGGRMYLSAYAQGLGATGLTFFDDDVINFFSPHATGNAAIFPGRNWHTDETQPLVTLVRLPTLKELRRPEASEKQCTLQGTGLYLLDSVSTDGQFQQSTPVPDGFAGSTLSVPHPTGTELYVKLRDDPTAVNKVILPVLPEKQ
jgi:hypothetical protein